MPLATVRSTLRAASAAIVDCVRLTVRSTSARWTENESQPSSATGRTPVRARKANRRARKDMSWLVVVPRSRRIRSLFECRAARKSPSISSNGWRSAAMCGAVLSALRMSGECQVLFQQALDAPELVRMVCLLRRAHFVEDPLSREQHLAAGALARHQTREKLQAARPQVLGGLSHARLENLDRRSRLRIFLADDGFFRVIEQTQARHRGGALDLRPDLLDRVLDAPGDVVEIVERLLQVVDRAEAERLDGGFRRGIAGHDDEGAMRLRLAHAAQHLDPVHARHVLVGEDAGDSAFA